MPERESMQTRGGWPPGHRSSSGITPTSLHALDLASRAFHDVVLGVIPEPAQRHGAPDRLGFGRDQRVDAAPLERAVNLGVADPASAVTVVIATPVVAIVASGSVSETFLSFPVWR